MDFDFQKLATAAVQVFVAVVGVAAVLGWAIDAEYVQNVSDRMVAAGGALAALAAVLPGLWNVFKGDA